MQCVNQQTWRKMILTHGYCVHMATEGEAPLHRAHHIFYIQGGISKMGDLASDLPALGWGRGSIRL